MKEKRDACCMIHAACWQWQWLPLPVLLHYYTTILSSIEAVAGLIYYTITTILYINIHYSIIIIILIYHTIVLLLGHRPSTKDEAYTVFITCVPRPVVCAQTCTTHCTYFVVYTHILQTQVSYCRLNQNRHHKCQLFLFTLSRIQLIKAYIYSRNALIFCSKVGRIVYRHSLTVCRLI